MFGSINLAHTNGSIFHWQITVNELAKFYHLVLQKEEIDYMIVKELQNKKQEINKKFLGSMGEQFYMKLNIEIFKSHKDLLQSPKLLL